MTLAGSDKIDGKPSIYRCKKVINNVHNIADLEGKLAYFGIHKVQVSLILWCSYVKIHRKLGGSYTFACSRQNRVRESLYDTFSGVGVVNDNNVIAGKRKESQDVSTYVNCFWRTTMCLP